MKKILFLLIVAAFFAACNTDDEGVEIFVTEIGMPSPEMAYAPGDAVTVEARGFGPDDDVMLDIRWPLTGEAIGEGYARGVYAVVTNRTSAAITFLAPGGYPASTTEVLLLRRGRMQSLGKISVRDGRAPAKYMLYGIAGPDAESGTTSGIDRIDLLTGEPTRIADFAQGQELSCAVNAAGTNRIYGLMHGASGTLGAFYDLTMRYLRDSDPEQYLVAGRIASDAAYLRSVGRQLYLTTMSATRTSPVIAPIWTLPDGLSAEKLTRYPFVCGEDGTLLLSADNGDGTFSPVVLFSRMDGYRVRVGDPVSCAALIPFNTVRTIQADGKTDNYLVGGYVVSAREGGASELRPYDTSSLTFDEPFATLPYPVRSVAVDLDSELQEIYCLLDYGPAEGMIRVYDQHLRQWSALSDEKHPYSEILLAR